MLFFMIEIFTMLANENLELVQVKEESGTRWIFSPSLYLKCTGMIQQWLYVVFMEVVAVIGSIC